MAAAERTAKSAEAVLDQLQLRRLDTLKSATMDQVHRIICPLQLMLPLADLQSVTNLVNFTVSVRRAPAASAGGAAKA